MVTEPVCVNDVGLKVTLEFGGKVLVLNVRVPTGGLVTRLAVKPNVAEVPAVTVAVLDEVGIIVTAGKTVAVSEALLLLVLASPIPETLAVLMRGSGTKVPRFTVRVMGG
jgi:hypothetical protein